VKLVRSAPVSVTLLQMLAYKRPCQPPAPPPASPAPAPLPLSPHPPLLLRAPSLAREGSFSGVPPAPVPPPAAPLSPPAAPAPGAAAAAAGPRGALPGLPDAAGAPLGASPWNTHTTGREPGEVAPLWRTAGEPGPSPWSSTARGFGVGTPPWCAPGPPEPGKGHSRVHPGRSGSSLPALSAAGGAAGCPSLTRALGQPPGLPPVKLGGPGTAPPCLPGKE